LESADLAQTAALAREALGIADDPKNLQQAVDIARAIVRGRDRRFLVLKAAFALLGIPMGHWANVMERWNAAGSPTFAEFAPYAAYCMEVELFFQIAVAKRLISPHRVSNRTDIAYLYYLPFAALFVSRDARHRDVTPLFMRGDQQFVWGDDLKADLRRLMTEHCARPDSGADNGLFHLPNCPPDDDSLCAKLWRAVYGRSSLTAPDVNLDAIRETNLGVELADKARRLLESVESGDLETREVDIDSPQHIVIERAVRPRLGRWRVLDDALAEEAQRDIIRSGRQGSPPKRG
jgi:hypothetical protein